MKREKIFYRDPAYVIGILVLALGTAFMEKADFGLSMIVAPAYLIHLKLSKFLPFFSFGMSEYVFQALLLVLLSIVMRKVKKGYFFSCVLSIALSLCLFRAFVGVSWGTVVCAFTNGFFIGLTSRVLERHFVFKDAFPKLKGKIT